MKLGHPILPPISSIDHYPQQQPQEHHSLLRPSPWTAPLKSQTISSPPTMMSLDTKLPFFDQPSRRLLPPQPKLASSPYAHESPKTVAIRKRMQQDMDLVISYCTHTRKTIQRHQHMIDMASHHPWLDDMIDQANEMLNALLRLQKQQLATQEEKRQALSYHNTAPGAGFYNRMPCEDNMVQYNNPFADRMSAGAGGARLRSKRRRPAFQGRCHSCNISETPEWRRGPDGARTLCNACGLHYAKVERKRQAAKAKTKTTEDTLKPVAVSAASRESEPCPISSPTSLSTSSSLQDETIMTP